MQTISKASTWAKLLYEFLGTAAMVIAFNTSREARASTYFFLWILAFKISGAHFNPATSLAVLIIERRVKNIAGFFYTFLVQIAGAFLGVGLSYLLVSSYLDVTLLPKGDQQYYNPTTGEPYWARPIIQETL